MKLYLEICVVHGQSKIGLQHMKIRVHTQNGLNAVAEKLKCSIGVNLKNVRSP